jgi:hypothetical protein
VNYIFISLIKHKEVDKDGNPPPPIFLASEEDINSIDVVDKRH